MHHFMRADLLESLAAVALYWLLLFAPGYVLGWVANLFEFRYRTTEFRCALSIPLSISVCPILIYLSGRFASAAVFGGLLASAWIYFVFLLVRHKVQWPRFSRASFYVVGAWLAIALFISVDLQIGVKDYYPITAFDYSLRSGFIHSIGTTGIPPTNPYFFSGHTVPLRYHYFWLLLPGLLYQATGYAISPRVAWIGAVFWCGLGFVCLIAVTFRVFWYRDTASFPRRAIAGILLLGVTGLDIIPAAFLWMLRAAGMAYAVLPSVEWWNDQVDGFLYTAVWEAHHLSGLIACLVAFLLLQEGARQQSLPRHAAYGLIGGAALATAVGSSIYITFVFAAYLVLWTLIAIARKWRQTVVVLVIAGAVGMVLALPYALSLRGPAGGTHGAAAPSGPPPIRLWMRPFYPTDELLKMEGFGTSVRTLVNTAVLPLNYFLELGFFGVAGVTWWRKRKAARKPLSQSELAVGVLVATSVVICTFLRSSLIDNNDLGWRGFLLAQFGMLLWSVDVLLDQPRTRLLLILLVLGAVGSFYDVAILRFYPVLADTGIVANRRWMAPDRQLGPRNYFAREAYEWIQRSTPINAVVQFDPHVSVQDTSAFLYADRQVAAADLNCLEVFGGDPPLCRALLDTLGSLYPDAGKPAAGSTESACASLPVDILIAKDTDTAWADSHGWVWTGKPIFSNRYYRLFRCRERARGM